MVFFLQFKVGSYFLLGFLREVGCYFKGVGEVICDSIWFIMVFINFSQDDMDLRGYNFILKGGVGVWVFTVEKRGVKQRLVFCRI